MLSLKHNHWLLLTRTELTTPDSGSDTSVIVYSTPGRQRPRMLVMEVKHNVAGGGKTSEYAALDPCMENLKRSAQIAQDFKFVAKTKNILIDDSDVTLLGMCLDTTTKDGPTVTCEFKSLAAASAAGLPAAAV